MEKSYKLISIAKKHEHVWSRPPKNVSISFLLNREERHPVEPGFPGFFLCPIFFHEYLIAVDDEASTALARFCHKSESKIRGSQLNEEDSYSIDSRRIRFRCVVDPTEVNQICESGRFSTKQKARKSLNCSNTISTEKGLSLAAGLFFLRLDDILRS